VRRLTLACLACLACEPTPAPDSSAALRLLASTSADAQAPEVFIAEPPTFVRRLRDSEAAASEVSGGPAKKLCAGLRAGDEVTLAGALTGDFLGRLTGPGQTVDFGDEGAVVRRFPPSPESLERGAFVTGLRAYLAPFTVVERCSFKPFRFKLEAPGRDRAVATHWFEVAGRDAEGRGVELRGAVRAELEKGEGWHFRRLEVESLRSVAVRALFRDVSGETGIGLHRDTLTTQSVQAVTNDQTIETIGGVGVVDWDADGDDDLLAWNRRMTLQLFLNDGAGGFDKRVNPIPPRAVGYFNVLVDLDGDGAPELASTEVMSCVDGQASLALFTRRGQRLVPLERRLVFEQPCARIDKLEYQHLVPHDIDGDGDLDLFAAGYMNQHSKGDTHNLFQARDGQRDLLFLNEGGLRFREVARERGLDTRSFGYTGVFFDYDDDGDDDLFVANDYGRNDLWLNDGAGHFSVGGGPLTANGQSMGVTIADFDGDAELDVYVSNMFSKAGNRIVPLMEGVVAEDTYETLLWLARGNALYRREGPGRYTEVAAEQGVARAAWAWGQAAFDADNDGDRDIYVLNGMTSHTDAAAPDY